MIIDNFILHHSVSNWGTSILLMEVTGAAFARIYWYNDEQNIAYLDMLSVSEGMRKQGIATKLQELREKLAINSGAKFVYLWVDKTTWMYDWYKRRGYINYRNKSTKENTIWMKKSLI